MYCACAENKVPDLCLTWEAAYFRSQSDKSCVACAYLDLITWFHSIGDSFTLPAAPSSMHSSTDSFACAHRCIFFKVNIISSTDSEAESETISIWQKRSFSNVLNAWGLWLRFGTGGGSSPGRRAAPGDRWGPASPQQSGWVDLEACEALHRRCVHPAECFQTVQMMVGLVNIGLGSGRTSTRPGDVSSLGAAYWLGAVVRQFCYHGNVLAKFKGSRCPN